MLAKISDKISQKSEKISQKKNKKKLAKNSKESTKIWQNQPKIRQPDQKSEGITPPPRIPLLATYVLNLMRGKDSQGYGMSFVCLNSIHALWMNTDGEKGEAGYSRISWR